MLIAAIIIMCITSFCNNSGLGPSMVGVLHVVIQFPLYEVLKTNLAARHVGTTHPEELSPVELIAASAISKMVASTGAMPTTSTTSCCV